MIREWWITVFCCTLAAQIAWRLYPPPSAIFLLLLAACIGLMVRGMVRGGWRVVLRSALVFAVGTILVVEAMLPVALDAGLPPGSSLFTWFFEERVVSGLSARVRDKNNDARRRVAAAGALERIYPERAEMVLLAVFRDKNDDAWVRWSMIEALRKRGVIPLIPALTAVQNDADEDEELRRRAAGMPGALIPPAKPAGSPRPDRDTPPRKRDSARSSAPG